MMDLVDVIKGDRPFPLFPRYFHAVRAIGVWIALGWLVIGLSSCGIPSVSAEDRLFLPLGLDVLDVYLLPKTEIDGVPVGGLSAITYDRPNDRFYAVSDDRSRLAPARFYTLHMIVDQDTPSHPTIDHVEIETVTMLTDEAGSPFPIDSVDMEGIALSPRHTVYIASEGVANAGIPPFIDEFDLNTGQRRSRLPIPDRYVPQRVNDQPQGVQDNLGFEALTVNLGGYSPSGWIEPFRLFATTEYSLAQDMPPLADLGIEPDSETDLAGVQSRNRILHYLVGQDQSTLLAEHLYLTDTPSLGTLNLGVSELLVIDQAGHFLSLERSFGMGGFSAKIFQVAIADATDISEVSALREGINNIQPVRKQLLLDLNTLNLPVDNLEGMTWGPQLPDGSRSLILVSDDNFNDRQQTQFWLLRLRE